MTAVFTIGYQESNPEAVIGTLAAAGVALLVDVRAVAASRRPGFSKRQLAAGVATVGIDYLHLRGLGTPPDGRLAARTGRYADMRRIFEAHMATGRCGGRDGRARPAGREPGAPCACSASSATPTIATAASWASSWPRAWAWRWSTSCRSSRGQRHSGLRALPSRLLAGEADVLQQMVVELGQGAPLPPPLERGARTSRSRGANGFAG